jgi:kumamolisin
MAIGDGATGGGESMQFDVPVWQNALQAATTSGTKKLRGRGVPDVSGDADPQSGYIVRVDGTDTVIGGTSAVAPLWAALIAILNSTDNRNRGLLNPALYAHPNALNDITAGNNGTFLAARGWDACTGLGSPNGEKLSTIEMPAPVGAGV